MISVESKLRGYSGNDLVGIKGQLDKQMFKLSMDAVIRLDKETLIRTLEAIAGIQGEPMTEQQTHNFAKSLYDNRRVQILGLVRRRVNLELERRELMR